MVLVSNHGRRCVPRRSLSCGVHVARVPARAVEAPDVKEDTVGIQKTQVKFQKIKLESGKIKIGIEKNKSGSRKYKSEPGK